VAAATVSVRLPWHVAAVHLTGRLPLTLQCRVHARTAIGLVAVAMHLAYPFQKSRIYFAPQTDWPVAPGIVATGAHAIDAAHAFHRMGFLVVVDESEDVVLRAEVKAIAFFKRSCSSLSCS